MPPLKPVVDLRDQASIDALYEEPVQDWTTFVLAPGQLVLCQASNALRLGSRVCGLIGTLSHLARVGLMAHLASPFILPGWDGHVALELFNAGPAPLRLYQDMAAARMILLRLDGSRRECAAAHPFYGSVLHLGSKYADEFGRPKDV